LTWCSRQEELPGSEGLLAVLDAGRLVECGHHAALLARGGPYAELVGRQLAFGRAAE
jgi:ATP-binding cassette subfamily C protein CydCD